MNDRGDREFEPRQPRGDRPERPERPETSDRELDRVEPWEERPYLYDDED